MNSISEKSLPLKSNSKKLKPADHYYFGSKFKRNLVRGLLLFSRNRNLEDIMLMLRETAATLYLTPSQILLWIRAYLILFKIEDELCIHLHQSTEKISDDQIRQKVMQKIFQQRNKGQKQQSKTFTNDKTKHKQQFNLKRIVMIILKELPITNKPDLNNWYRNIFGPNSCTINLLQQQDEEAYVDNLQEPQVNMRSYQYRATDQHHYQILDDDIIAHQHSENPSNPHFYEQDKLEQIQYDAYEQQQ